MTVRIWLDAVVLLPVLLGQPATAQLQLRCEGFLKPALERTRGHVPARDVVCWWTRRRARL